jgi:hypothetical protein
MKRSALFSCSALLAMVMFLGFDLAKEYRRGARLPATTVALTAMFCLMFYLVLKIYLGTGWANGMESRHRAAVDGGELESDYGEQEVALDTEGVHVSSLQGSWSRNWARGVDSIVETPEHFFLYSSVSAALVIPKRAFESPGQADEFARLARAQLAAAGGSSAARELRELARTREIRCPECRYEIREVIDPRCPECGLRLHVRDFQAGAPAARKDATQ